MVTGGRRRLGEAQSGSKPERRPVPASSSALASKLAAAALALSLAGHTAPAVASDAVATLTVVGQVSPKCSIDLDSDTVDHQLTDGPGRERVGLSVDCNQRLVVNMQSQNGGFLHESGRRDSGSPQFISLVPYQTTFEVDSAGAAPVSFRSDQMLAGASGSVGVTPFKARGALILDWSPEKPLLGGSYSDVIEIRVSGEGEANASST